MKQKYFSVDDIMKRIWDEYEQMEYEYDLDEQDEMRANLNHLENDLIIECKKKDLANNTSFETLEISEFKTFFLEQRVTFANSFFPEAINPLDEKNSEISKLKKRCHILEEQNKEFKNKLESKQEMDFLFPTKYLTAMAKAQKEFWKKGVETTPPVVKKQVMLEIVNELSLKLDKNNNNRKVDELVRAISPDRFSTE